MLKHILCAGAMLGLLAAPVLAQDDVDTFMLPPFNGLAVAQAPEAGLGICLGPLAEDAISCAVSECMAQSGLGPDDCVPNLWCYPHGWAADIFMQHSEGSHWHKFVCDQQSRERLDALVDFECAQDFLAECAAVRIWDPDGSEVILPESN